MVKKLYYSTSYYPELWDETKIDEDIAYMKDLNINTVRIGDFAWSSMERDIDKIDLAFFKRVINKLHENAIYTVLCTPTAAPPVWMTYGHPERLFVNEKGVTYTYGARQHMCTNNHFFRERVKILVEQMAKELGSLPGVVAWQIDNEMKAHVAECYCETCKKEWAKWLENKYGTIEKLNEAWGTKVWSQEYDSFGQITQPFETPFLHNASLMTQYRLFTMETITAFSNMQVTTIRKHSSKKITHNTGLSFSLNNEAIFEEMDFVSFDAYPSQANYMHLVFQYDLWRSLKKGIPFWFMETSPAHGGNIQKTTSPHPTGFLKAEAMSALAAGAEGFSYWLFKGQRAGCEISHAALLYSWGKPGLGYKEAKDIGKEIKKIESFILKTKVSQAEVAIMYSDIARAFFKTESLEKINYVDRIKYMHEAIVEKGIFRDVIYPSANLQGYKVVITSYMPYMSEELLQKLEHFVREGGIWIVGPMSGYRTKDHTVHLDCALGEIEALAGISVEDFYSVRTVENTMEGFKQQGIAMNWITTLNLVEGQEMATIKNDCHEEKTIISERKLGKGKVILLGALPNQEFLQEMISHYCEEVSVTKRYQCDKRIVIIPREDEYRKYSMAVNMTGEHITDLHIYDKVITLEPYGYKIIEDEGNKDGKEIDRRDTY